ncbi:MAG: hypothetical protein GY749_28890, partial [Desulfobacteraceae bacterium]|nr:hypothetical protein [Desulfobacteraceae bacterium]
DIAAPPDDLDEISTDIDIESEADTLPFEDIAAPPEELDEISTDIDIESEADTLPLEDIAAPPDDLGEISSDIDIESEADTLPLEDIAAPSDDLGEISSDIEIESEADTLPPGYIAPEELDEIITDIFSFEDETDDLDKISADIGLETEADTQQPATSFSFEDELAAKKAEPETISSEPEESAEPAHITDKALLKWPPQIAELAVADYPEKLETALAHIVKEDRMSEMITQSINRLVEGTVAVKIKRVKKNYKKGLYSAKR